MVVYVVVTSFLRNVAFLIYALFGEISILEIPVVGNFSLFAGLSDTSLHQTAPYFHTWSLLQFQGTVETKTKGYLDKKHHKN